MRLDTGQLSRDDLEQQLAIAKKENEALRQKVEAKKFSWRNFFSYLLLVLGLAIVIPASLLIWANRTISDTQQYVNTIGPIIHESSVQQAIVKSATTNLYATVNIQQEVANLLPTQAQPLAGPITGQVKNYINASVAKIVASPQFANLWVNVNRRLQERFMTIASSGSTSEVVNVNQLYQFVTAQLASTPLAALATKQLPPQVGQIQILTIPALAKIPHYMSTLITLKWVFFGLAIGLLIIATALSRNRRKTVLQIGLGWMIATVVGLLILRISRGLLLGQIQDQTYQQAAASIWQALLKPFYLQSAVLFLIGLFVALVAWLLGPSRAALGWRTSGTNLLAKRRTAWLPNIEHSAVADFLRRNHTAALWVILALTITALLALVPLTIMSLSVVLICALLIWLLLEFLIAPIIPKRASSR